MPHQDRLKSRPQIPLTPPAPLPRWGEGSPMELDFNSRLSSPHLGRGEPKSNLISIPVSALPVGMEAEIEFDLNCFTAPLSLIWRLPSKPQKRHPPPFSARTGSPPSQGPEMLRRRQILRRRNRRHRETHRSCHRPSLRHRQSGRRPNYPRHRQNFFRQSRRHPLPTGQLPPQEELADRASPICLDES